MATAAFAVSVVAVLIALGSLIYTRRTSQTGRREHDLHLRQDHLARTPQITIALHPEQTDELNPRYVVTLDGPQDLDSVTVRRPYPTNNLVYPLAVNGSDWADDVTFAPLQAATSGTFRQAVGNGEAPEFVCEVVCRRGDEAWKLMKRLDPPITPQFHAWSEL